jgi:signal transduction histidine kinase
VPDMEDPLLARTQIVKGRPIFKRHLYISSVLFLAIIIMASILLVRLLESSMRDRANLEMHALSNDLALQLREYLQSSKFDNQPANPAAQLQRAYALNNFITQLLDNQNNVDYLFVQDLEGTILGQGFRLGMELEQNQFTRLMFSAKNPRPPQIEFASLTDPQVRISDTFVPVHLAEDGQMTYIHIGIDRTRLERQFLQWQGALFNRIIFSAAALIGVLALVMLYVLWLLKRAQLVEAKAHMTDRLALLGTMASGLAHEIRNPLSAMNLNLQMIEEDLPGADHNAELASLLASTRLEIKRLERLANNFLLYAKPLKLEAKHFPAGEFLEQVAALVARECEKEQIEIVRDPVPAALLVKADRDLLQQALLNLVINAMDSVKEQPPTRRQIRLSAQQQNHKLIFQVRDSGRGVGEEEARNLFKLFYSSKRGGTGLGLPIAQRVVESHGGSIAWENCTEGGAQFTIAL